MERKFGPVSFIPGSNSGKYPYCNSLYIEADLRVVMDPGSDRKRLQELLESPGVDVAWLSHWHEDHITHLDLFDDKELWISELDAPLIRDLDSFCEGYGLTDKEKEYWAPLFVDQFHFRARTPSRLIEPGDRIDLGGVSIDVIGTPGHTPGHCSFFFRELGMLFLGDYDLTPFGPWYGDVGSSIDKTIESVNRLRSIPAGLWITAHEDGIFEADPGEHWNRYLKVIDHRDEKLLEFLSEPRTMEEVINAGLVYGKNRRPREFFVFGEDRLMGKHLERLIEKGAVQFDGNRYRRS